MSVVLSLQCKDRADGSNDGKGVRRDLYSSVCPDSGFGSDGKRRLSALRTLRMDVQDEYSSLAERDDAVESMRELAENGDIHAQYFMGELYRDGPLLPPDWVMARYWFDKAAKQGYAAAQYDLVKLYLSDDASVHDSELGIQWLEHAAYNGNHDASYRLGKEYLKGESVRRDTRKAMDHIYTSAQAGNLHPKPCCSC